MSSILAWLAGGVGVIFFLLVGIAQMVIGYMGIEYHLGGGWAIGLVIASLVFRITFPLTIGTFFGALDVLGWSWIGALLITLPGLLLMVPGAIGMGIVGLTSLFKGTPQNSYQTDYKTNNYEEPINVTPRKSETKTIKKVTKKKKVAKKKVAKRKSTKK